MNPSPLGQRSSKPDCQALFGTAGNGDSVGAVFASDLFGNAALLYTNDYEAGDSCDFFPPVDLVSAANGTLYFFNDYFGDAGEVDGLTPAAFMGLRSRAEPTVKESSTRRFGANPADQASPMCSSGPLTLGSNGNLYGTYCSVIFQVNPRGQETVLHTMTATDGQSIANSLLQADDGNFYGVTTTGGENNAGTVFKLVVPGSH